MLSNESKKIIAPYLGQPILAISIHDDETLEIVVDNPSLPSLFLADHAQSCCEHRWMSTDDDLAYYVGATLLDVTVDAAEEQEDDMGYAAHDIQFLRLHTDRGIIVFANHNEHNGYYGGFSVKASTR